MVFAGATEGRQFAAELRRTVREALVMTVYAATEYGGELLREELLRTPSGEDSCVEIRTGRLNAEEMRAEMLRQRPDFVVDCTHPHARAVTENIIAACEAARCRYLRLRREGDEGEHSGAVYVDAITEAAEFLKSRPGVILATTGSKEAEALAGEELRDRVFLRILPLEEGIRKCRGLGFKVKNLICMQGPFSEALNRAMLRQIGASWLLTKESGDNGGFAEKLSAAALENVAAVVVRRPREEGGYALDELLGIIANRETSLPVPPPPALAQPAVADPPPPAIPAPPQPAVADPEPPAVPAPALSAAPATQPQGGAAEKLRWFPFFRNIQGKRAVIAGGGAVALRRVKTLLHFDCSIVIIAPELHGELAAAAAANPGSVSVALRPFALEDCRGDFVLALTNDRELNRRISLECRRKDIPVSVADCREESTFYFPAVILWDKMVAGLSSGGTDHALVRKTADRLRALIAEGGFHG
jgi:precorrin-2 dehydrogenase/sirohydrochlorin ferrochelatase/precorrin-6A/cobalt-precorrin-6A reductase